MAERPITREELKTLVEDIIEEKAIMAVTPAWEIFVRGLLRELRDPATICANIEKAKDIVKREVETSLREEDWRSLSKQLDELRLLGEIEQICGGEGK